MIGDSIRMTRRSLAKHKGLSLHFHNWSWRPARKKRTTRDRKLRSGLNGPGAHDDLANAVAGACVAANVKRKSQIWTLDTLPNPRDWRRAIYKVGYFHEIKV